MHKDTLRAFGLMPDNLMYYNLYIDSGWVTRLKGQERKVSLRHRKSQKRKFRAVNNKIEGRQKKSDLCSKKEGKNSAEYKRWKMHSSIWVRNGRMKDNVVLIISKACLLAAEIAESERIHKMSHDFFCLFPVLRNSEVGTALLYRES